MNRSLQSCLVFPISKLNLGCQYFHLVVLPFLPKELDLKLFFDKRRQIFDQIGLRMKHLVILYVVPHELIKSDYLACSFTEVSVFMKLQDCTACILRAFYTSLTIFINYKFLDAALKNFQIVWKRTFRSCLLLDRESAEALLNVIPELYLSGSLLLALLHPPFQAGFS